MRGKISEALRQGSTGVARGYRLEASPWGLDLASIKVPVDIWQGQDDTLVSPMAARILSDAIPDARLHLIKQKGHFSLILDEAERYVSSAGMASA